MTAYTTCDEAILREIIEPLGDYADDFDIDAIADEYLSGHSDGYAPRSGADLYEIAARHDMTAEAEPEDHGIYRLTAEHLSPVRCGASAIGVRGTIAEIAAELRTYGPADAGSEWEDYPATVDALKEFATSRLDCAPQHVEVTA